VTELIISVLVLSKIADIPMKRSKLYVYSIHTLELLKKNVSMSLKFCVSTMCKYGAVLEYRLRDTKVDGLNPPCST
jgi:hypothetical protein